MSGFMFDCPQYIDFTKPDCEADALDDFFGKSTPEMWAGNAIQSVAVGSLHAKAKDSLAGRGRAANFSG